MIFSRSNSYIGTLVDDLVTKGVMDPYRMMTSRSEYRLLLRQDNADMRLTPLGHEIGLISDERYARFLEKKRLRDEELERLASHSIPPTPVLNAMLEAKGTSPVRNRNEALRTASPAAGLLYGPRAVRSGLPKSAESRG